MRGHEEALRHGGAVGIVSEHVINSALSRPYHGYYQSIHEKEGALIHGIVSNHGFVDGNKRTALYLVELLSQRSGYDFVEDDEVIADTITSVTRGEIAYEVLAQWFCERLVETTGH